VIGVLQQHFSFIILCNSQQSGIEITSLLVSVNGDTY